MHMDNPIAFANIIINDLVEGANEPVLTVAEYAEMGMSMDNQDYQAQFEEDLSQMQKETGEASGAS